MRHVHASCSLADLLERRRSKVWFEDVHSDRKTNGLALSELFLFQAGPHWSYTADLLNLDYQFLAQTLHQTRIRAYIAPESTTPSLNVGSIFCFRALAALGFDPSP